MTCGYSLRDLASQPQTEEEGLQEVWKIQRVLGHNPHPVEGRACVERSEESVPTPILCLMHCCPGLSCGHRGFQGDMTSWHLVRVMLVQGPRRVAGPPIREDRLSGAAERKGVWGRV